MHNRAATRREALRSWERTQESVKLPRIVAIVTRIDKTSRPYLFRGPGSIPHAVNGLAIKLMSAPRV